MKARFIIILFLFQFVCSYSQTTLTNAQVYNYSVGDTIQYTIPNALCGVSPSYSSRFIVLQKTVSANQLDYIVNQTTMDGCGGCAGTNWNYNATLTVTINNADSLVKHQLIYNHSLCITSQSLYTDTNFVTTYGKQVNQRKFLNTSNVGGCSVNYGLSSLIEGVGEFYTLTVNQNGDPCYYAKNIVYVHKIGEAPFGNRIDFPTVGIKEMSSLDGITLFPNPIFNGKICLSNDKLLKVRVSITTLEGKLIYEEESNSSLIEISKEIIPGFYFVKCQIDSKESIVKKVLVY